MASFFSKEESARYDRHFKLPGFGLEAQQKLKSAKVLVVGAGGLGERAQSPFAVAHAAERNKRC